jgi:hypothetical protein
VARVVCPNCGAEQTSPHGFVPGEVARCRRCDASFKVPNRVTAALAGGDDDPGPARRGGWLFSAAVAVVVAVVLAGVYAAVVVADRTRAEEAERAQEAAEAAAADRRVAEAAEVAARRPPPVGLFGGPTGQPALTPEQSQKTAAALAARLVGAWAGGGREVEYRADGTFRDGPLEGTWQATQARGTRVLVVRRSAGRSPLRVAFEGDELVHDAPEPGVSHVLRKK